MNDDEFLIEFINGRIGPERFDHEAHLRLTWINITKYGLKEAIGNVSNQIKKYVSTLGYEDKYHHTLTVASVQIVHHFMLKSNEYSFSEFIKKFPSLKSDFKRLIYSHYSSERLNSEEARFNYIEPDILVFD